MILGFNRLSPPRAIVKSTVFHGFRLPAGTHIHAHPGSVHMDPDEFGPDPEEFKPERFLDRDGKFRYFRM